MTSVFSLFNNQIKYRILDSLLPPAPKIIKLTGGYIGDSKNKNINISDHGKRHIIEYKEIDNLEYLIIDNEGLVEDSFYEYFLKFINESSSLKEVDLEMTDKINSDNTYKLNNIHKVLKKKGVNLIYSIFTNRFFDFSKMNENAASYYSKLLALKEYLDSRNSVSNYYFKVTPENCYFADDVFILFNKLNISNSIFYCGLDENRKYEAVNFTKYYKHQPSIKFHLICFYNKLAGEVSNDINKYYYYNCIAELLNENALNINSLWLSLLIVDMFGNVSLAADQSVFLGSLTDKSITKILSGSVDSYRNNDLICSLSLDRNKEILGKLNKLKFGYKRYIDSIRENIYGKYSKPNHNYIFYDSTNKSMHKWNAVLITGWYGTETPGDKAILCELVDIIKSINNQCRIVLTTINKFVSIKTVDELNLTNSIELTKISDAFKSEIIAKVDAVIIAGGPLMDTPYLKYIYKIFHEANKQKKSRVIFGCGIGPLTQKKNIKIVDSILRMCTAGFFRDKVSYENAIKVTKDKDFYYSCDPALSYVSKWKSENKNCCSQTKSFSIAGLLRANTNEYYKTDKSQHMLKSNKHFAKIIAKSVEDVCEESHARFNLVAMCSLDVGGDDRIFNRFVNSNFINRKYVNLNRSYLTLDQTLKLLSENNLSLAMRYHGHIFSMGLSIPFISIDYSGKNGKVNNLLQELGYTKWSMEWDKIEPSLLRDLIFKLFDNKDEVTSGINQRVNYMLEKLNDSYEKVFYL